MIERTMRKDELVKVREDCESRLVEERMIRRREAISCLLEFQLTFDNRKISIVGVHNTKYFAKQQVRVASLQQNEA